MESPAEAVEVVEAFADSGLNVTPETAERVAAADRPDEVVAAVAAAADGPVVTVDDLAAVRPEVADGAAGDADAARAATAGAAAAAAAPTETLAVQGDVTDRSTCTGEFEDFVSLFRDRFAQLSEMLRTRVSPRNVSAIGDGGRSAAVVGMVKDVRQTGNDNYLVELEDPTGSIRALLRADDHRDEAERLLPDEVIGVEGRMSDDGAVLYADDLYLPGVPKRRSPPEPDVDARIAMTSDLHVGSVNFADEKWEAFTDWLGTADVDHLLIAGDLVEGVGVYPGQQEELTVVDIHEQYRRCAERLREIPDDVAVFAITGNHDSVRLAEPQPALPEEFRAAFPDDVVFAGNPVTVEIHGVSFLLYHGASLNGVVEQIPDARVEEPAAAMRHLLEKRHLAPMYGGHVRLAPEERDYLVIDEVPDVVHMGHVHTFGYEQHHGVHLLDTGAWQTQTAYQRKLDIEPDVGYCAVLDLPSMEIRAKRF